MIELDRQCPDCGWWLTHDILCPTRKDHTSVLECCGHDPVVGAVSHWCPVRREYWTGRLVSRSEYLERKQ